MSNFAAKQSYVARQIAHWRLAAARLRTLDDLVSRAAWESLEQYLGVAVRQCLLDAVVRLEQRGEVLLSAYQAARTEPELDLVRRQLLDFRLQYLRTETTVDFYADAINTRSSPEIGALLRACDALASRSMAMVLEPLGKATPLVMSYIDCGIGAAILKADLRLWDQSTLSPAAAIKVVRHNLHRPTALIHETGHQVAHIVGWTEELASHLGGALASAPKPMGRIWASWASEIAADAFAFVHTGYASVAGLHDVVAGGERSVFGFRPGDPHPISYLRVRLGIEMCRSCFGSGPWDELEQAWVDTNPLTAVRGGLRGFLERSLAFLPAIADVCLRAPMNAFEGRSLSALVNPTRVRPDVLIALEAQLGPALYTSMHWIWTEGLRLLALTGYRAATSAADPIGAAHKQEDWMLRLGGALRAA